VKLSVALRLGRVSNLPTVTTNVLAALALAGATPAPWAIAVICVAISLLYVAGMFLNDAFDRTVDAVQRPERPIPSGEVTAAEVFGAGFAMLAFGILAIAGVALTTGAGWWPIGSAVALSALIVYYDLRHKSIRWSPVVMGLCRVGAYTTAALAGGGAVDESLLIGCGLLLAYLIGLSYIARHENSSKLTQLWPLAFMILPFVVLQPSGGGPWMFAIYLMFAGWTARCLWLVRKRNFKIAVGGLIAGISLLDALFVIRAGSEALAGIACAMFLLTTVLQRRVPGT
jgi:4-hydroxybenzoate polyprenyltransferase